MLHISLSVEYIDLKKKSRPWKYVIIMIISCNHKCRLQFVTAPDNVCYQSSVLRKDLKEEIR